MTTYDVVLRGGRVIDPETGLDAIADVAIAAGRIAEIGTELEPAPVDLSVAGHVVTAGFIDLHSHTADIPGLRLRALDGVTTALELEAGVTPVAPAYQRAAGHARRVVADAQVHDSGGDRGCARGGEEEPRQIGRAHV